MSEQMTDNVEITCKSCRDFRKLTWMLESSCSKLSLSSTEMSISSWLLLMLASSKPWGNGSVGRGGKVSFTGSSSISMSSPESEESEGSKGCWRAFLLLFLPELAIAEGRGLDGSGG